MSNYLKIDDNPHNHCLQFLSYTLVPYEHFVRLESGEVGTELWNTLGGRKMQENGNAEGAGKRKCGRRGKAEMRKVRKYGKRGKAEKRNVIG